eukprot:gene461-2001_t
MLLRELVAIGGVPDSQPAPGCAWSYQAWTERRGDWCLEFPITITPPGELPNITHGMVCSRDPPAMPEDHWKISIPHTRDLEPWLPHLAKAESPNHHVWYIAFSCGRTRSLQHRILGVLEAFVLVHRGMLSHNLGGKLDSQESNWHGDPALLTSVIDIIKAND